MLQITATGIRQTITRLGRVASSLSDGREFFQEEAIPILESESQEIFDTEGFGSWPPLDPDYAAFKLRTVGDKGILRYSDDYFLSLTESGHAGAERDIKRYELVFGYQPEFFTAKSGAPYPLFHESGGERLPRRPVIAFLTQSRVVTRLGQAYTSYVEKIIRRF